MRTCPGSDDGCSLPLSQPGVHRSRPATQHTLYSWLILVLPSATTNWFHSTCHSKFLNDISNVKQRIINRKGGISGGSPMNWRTMSYGVEQKKNISHQNPNLHSTVWKACLEKAESSNGDVFQRFGSLFTGIWE